MGAKFKEGAHHAEDVMAYSDKSENILEKRCTLKVQKRNHTGEKLYCTVRCICICNLYHQRPKSQILQQIFHIQQELH